jgi:hypothetical protein
MIWTIIVGIIAGFLAGKIMKGSGYGILLDLALGATRARRNSRPRVRSREESEDVVM